ncbi:MAG: bifunctional methylenetetrahydrofolate dehydrogenase/methenyltetrahydrofolate cyclohydrolase FolD [Victivallaceae bacterium]
MPAQIIDGKKIADKIKQQCAAEAAELKALGIVPGLAVVLIGHDPASQVYVGSKVKTCAELGFHSEKIVLDADATQTEVLEVVRRLNADPAIHGILVQSPPPPQIDEKAIIEAIDPAKDVDCFHAVNVGKLLIGEEGFAPCTPKGVLVLLSESGIDPAGKSVVVIGRSNIVGKPLVALFLQKAKGANATVTCVHSATPDIAEYTKRADIVVAAIGKPEFVRGTMLKPGAVVIDVGINRIPDAASAKGYRLVGDVNFKEASEVASFITPVPGGVGPMTIAMLMKNTLLAARKQGQR